MFIFYKIIFAILLYYRHKTSQTSSFCVVFKSASSETVTSNIYLTLSFEPLTLKSINLLDSFYVILFFSRFSMSIFWKPFYLKRYPKHPIFSSMDAFSCWSMYLLRTPYSFNPFTCPNIISFDNVIPRTPPAAPQSLKQFH